MYPGQGDPPVYDAPPVYKKVPRVDAIMPEIDWSFMYIKESASVGKGIPMSGDKLAQVIGQTQSLRTLALTKGAGKNPIMFEKDEEIGIPLQGNTTTSLETSKELPTEKEALEGLLETYNHQPKEENPLYTTSQNLIGCKKPSPATFTFERRARNQGFSNSFNSIKYRDMGLNTALTRSNVASRLDPQFA
ncbi:unnamed protein product [Chrysoparadoxa australica]